MSQSGEGAIMIVEDEEPLRELVGEILEDQGYRVTYAISGDDALQVWERTSQPIDLVVTDLVMPGDIKGEDLVTALRERKPELKVIFTTGYSQEAFQGRKLSLKRGINFLQKPYRPAELVELVEGYLGPPPSSPG